MNILMIFHAAPCPPELGPGRRHFYVLRELLKRHQVSVLSFGTPEQHGAFVHYFGDSCPQVRFVDNRISPPKDVLMRLVSTVGGRSVLRRLYSSKLQDALDGLAAEQQFDLVICSTPFLAQHRFPPGVSVVSDTHNVEWLVMQRSCRETRCFWRKLYYFLQARHTRRDEMDTASRVEAVLMTSACDLRMFRRDLPAQRLFVVPNGVDVSAYRVSHLAPEPYTLLFTGLMSYYPNAHGIAWFLDEIFPRILASVPRAKLIVAGAQPPRSLRARRSDNVVITGYVNDIKPYFARAKVVVVPLRIGGGTRVKILEAMAMNRPVVATTLACEGLDVVHDESALLADTPEAFADSVTGLLRDGPRRESLSRGGYALVRQRYDWVSIGVELDRILRSVQRARSGSRTVRTA